MLDLAGELRDRSIGLRVLNLGGGDFDTKKPMEAMVFTVMAALAQMELEIKRERINDSVTKRHTTGGDLGGRRPTFTDSQIRTAAKLIQTGEPATQVARDMGMSRATLYCRIKEQNRNMARYISPSSKQTYFVGLTCLDITNRKELMGVQLSSFWWVIQGSTFAGESSWASIERRSHPVTDVNLLTGNVWIESPPETSSSTMQIYISGPSAKCYPLRARPRIPTKNWVRHLEREDGREG